MIAELFSGVSYKSDVLQPVGLEFLEDVSFRGSNISRMKSVKLC